MSNTLSVEIFTDQTTELNNVSTAEDAIKMVNEYASRLEIVRSHRKIKLGAASVALNSAGSIHWPSFSAQLNIVLTDRTIDRNHPSTIGQALPAVPPRNGVALIDMHKSSYPRSVIAHEIGHLLYINDPRNQPDPTHCSDDQCIMYHESSTQYDKQRIQQRGFKRWREKNGYRKAEFATVETAQQNEFCDECKQQLAKKAFFLLEVYNGNPLASTWLESC